MLTKTAVEALRFLALSDDEKLRYLPAPSADIRYDSGEEGADEMDFPAEAAFTAALRVLRDTQDDLVPPLQELRRELLSVMDLILRMADWFPFSFWWMEKKQHGVRAADDVLWLVLERYARLALQVAEVPSSPTLEFDSFIREAGFSIWRIERHPL